MDRRRYMGAKGGGGLPYDAMVTYLESTGTQFIVTDFAPNQNTFRCVVKVERTTSGGDNMVLWVSGSNSYFCNINWYMTTVYFRFRGANVTKPASLGTHVFELGNPSKVDGSEIATGTSMSFVGNTKCLRLFSSSSANTRLKGRIYYVKAYYGDTLVLDLIPVRVGQVGYMYDRISGKLFGNSGSGDFLIGDDIVPIEYLESSGTQYIDTGIKPTASFTFDTQIAATQSSYNCVFWGCRSYGDYKTENSQCYCNSNSTTGEDGHLRLYTTDARLTTNWDSGIVMQVNTMYTFTNMTCVPTMLDMTQNITLFALNSLGTIVTSVGKCRIARFTAYNNNAKVMDMIPVRIGTTGYMYNIVSSEWFANAGTGDFILGADVNPTELPYDAEVYYLESTGTQYIDTGIVPDENTGIEIDIVSKYREDVYLFGLREDNNDTRWCAGQSSVGFYGGYGTLLVGRHNSNSAIISLNFQNNKQFNIIKDSSITTLSENLPTLSFTPTKSIFLFGCDYINESRGAKCRVCSVKISQGSEVIMDLIPVRKGQVGYMYDKISGQMLGNDGTGAFVFGQDKSEDYVQEGLVFYLDGINKGGDNSAWLDIIRGAEFAYNEHSTANTDNVAMDGAGIISSDFMIGYDYRTSTIEIVFNVSNTDSGIVFYSGVDYGISFMIAGAGYSYANGSGRSNNQYNITKSTGNVAVSMSYDNIVLNGTSPTFTKSMNEWNVDSETSIGGRKTGNQYLKACTIYAIRIYNRKLSTTEMIANQRVDNQRFNLGLNI